MALFDEPNDIVQLIIRLRYDDAAAVYINGQEAIRTSNLPDLASFNKYASNATPDADTFFEFVVSPNLMNGLVAGTNTIAVEVHASAPYDNDVIFDLELAAVMPDVDDVPLRLHPGINRLTVQEIDAPDGVGNVLQSQYVDIWYPSPNGVTTVPGGMVGEDTVLDPDGGPYHFTEDVIIAAGTRYTILPGTTLYFDEDVEFLVHGILDAQGTEYERIRFNIFGTNKGHNDIIDAVSGFRPNPILEIRDNVFLGSGDEGLDLGGDVYVEGNLFMNIGRDEDNRGRLYANAISTGDASGDTPTVVLARNVFWNVDHVIHLRGGDAAIAENNTIVGIRDDYVDESGRTNITSAFHLFVESDSAGAGAFLADNIFWEIPRVFGNPDQPGGTISQLELTHNLLDPRIADNPIGERPVTLRDLGTGNMFDEPGFVDAAVGNFKLVAGSPGKGAGRFGQDVGAFVRAGIWITDEPDLFTNDSIAKMTLGGPGIFGLRYRLDGGPWSDVVTISERFKANGTTARTVAIDLNDLTARTLMSGTTTDSWLPRPRPILKELSNHRDIAHHAPRC